MSDVTLHIERLVIEGLPVGSHDGPLVQAAIEAELARLIGEGGFANEPQSSRSVALVKAEPLATPAPGGMALGTQIGQAIYGGIGR